jgi:hypothetical protein
LVSFVEVGFGVAVGLGVAFVVGDLVAVGLGLGLGVVVGSADAGMPEPSRDTTTAATRAATADVRRRAVVRISTPTLCLGVTRR